MSDTESDTSSTSESAPYNSDDRMTSEDSDSGIEMAVSDRQLKRRRRMADYAHDHITFKIPAHARNKLTGVDYITSRPYPRMSTLCEEFLNIGQKYSPSSMAFDRGSRLKRSQRKGFMRVSFAVTRQLKCGLQIIRGRQGAITLAFSMKYGAREVVVEDAHWFLEKVLTKTLFDLEKHTGGFLMHENVAVITTRDPDDVRWIIFNEQEATTYDTFDSSKGPCRIVICDSTYRKLAHCVQTKILGNTTLLDMESLTSMMVSMELECEACALAFVRNLCVPCNRPALRANWEHSCSDIDARTLHKAMSTSMEVKRELCGSDMYAKVLDMLSQAMPDLCMKVVRSQAQAVSIMDRYSGGLPDTINEYVDLCVDENGDFVVPRDVSRES